MLTRNMHIYEDNLKGYQTVRNSLVEVALLRGLCRLKLKHYRLS